MRLNKVLITASLFAAVILTSVQWAEAAGKRSQATPGVESSTIPSDSNYIARPVWNHACEARVQAVAGKRVDLIFIGDSITENWVDPDWGDEFRGRLVWYQNYADRYALNFGVGADKTENVLWRMDNMPIRELHPKVAVVLIGVNNYEYSAQEIAAGTRAILDKTLQFYPGIKIILVSILPNRLAYKTMMDANAITRTFADNDNIFYLDLMPLFVPDGDNWIGIGKDHLHLNEVGYRIWVSAMQPLLDKLLPRDK
jgi:lysophospholipase L1-like esterase